MNRLLILIISLSVLSGCTTKMVYPPMTKQGISDQQKKQDAYECKKEAVDLRSKLAVGPGGSAGAMSGGFGVMGAPGKRQVREATEQANDFYIECMELRGYRKDKDN